MSSDSTPPSGDRGTDLPLRERVAAVAGGNTCVGGSIVLALAAAGADIVIDYVAHPEATDEVERQVLALGDSVIGVQADVSEVDQAVALVDPAVDRFGSLDIWVNNAGIETRTGILDTSEEDYDRVLPVNLRSAFFCTQLAAR